MDESGRKRVINAYRKQDEALSVREWFLSLLAISSVRSGLLTTGLLLASILASVVLESRIGNDSVSASVNVIQRAINVTRKLYADRVDVGSGSVMTGLLLARPFEDTGVKIRWREGGIVDVRNQFGGKLDLVALHDHFEVHYEAVPASVCAKIAMEMAPSRMPLFINTIYFSGPPVLEKAEKACYAEANNMVFKFR